MSYQKNCLKKQIELLDYYPVVAIPTATAPSLLNGGTHWSLHPQILTLRNAAKTLQLVTWLLLTADRNITNALSNCTISDPLRTPVLPK